MNVLFEYNKIYEKGEREGAIKELEKIHEEISKRLKTKDESQFDLGRKSELAYLGNLIDKHIAELKGE